MMYVGKIDKTIYECITPDIATEYVIITQKQLDHIADHHPEAYNETLIELRTTLEDPEYIIKDASHINTGLVIRKLPLSENHAFIVLRVCTDTENGRLSNSIISAWKISQKRLDNYLRNKIILYKKGGK